MRRVRDPVHGFITLTPVEARLVETRAFQRLRRVHQLGLTHYVYPGAEHSRFQHALGVLHVAGQLCEALGRQGCGPENPELVRIAGLLHDLGHPPFSHAGEQGVRHELRTLRLVERGEVAEVLQSFGHDPVAVAGLIAGSGEAVGCGIVSGELDADRMDYLLRDSRMCGVRYGEFDIARVIESATVARVEGKPRLAVRSSGLHAVEGLLLARYSMFQQVYFHRTRRILDLFLEEVMPTLPDNDDEWLRWDDCRAFVTLQDDERPIAQAIVHRKLPACVVEMEVSNAESRGEADHLSALLTAAVPGRVWVDSTARMRAFRPEGDVPVVEPRRADTVGGATGDLPDDHVRSVFSASPVLRAMDPHVEQRRVYVERAHADLARALVQGFRQSGTQLRLF